MKARTRRRLVALVVMLAALFGMALATATAYADLPGAAAQPPGDGGSGDNDEGSEEGDEGSEEGDEGSGGAGGGIPGVPGEPADLPGLPDIPAPPGAGLGTPGLGDLPGVGDVLGGEGGVSIPTCMTDPFPCMLSGLNNAMIEASSDVLTQISDFGAATDVSSQSAAGEINEASIGLTFDPSHPAFQERYATGFGIAVVVMIIMIIWSLLRAARDPEHMEEVKKSLFQYLPLGVLLCGAGPAIGGVLASAANELTAAVYEEIELVDLMADMEFDEPGQMLLAILLMLALIIAAISVLIMVIVQTFALYITGSIMAIGFMMMIDPSTRPKALKLPALWIGLVFAKPLIFFLLGLMSGLLSAASLDDNWLVNLLAAIVGLLLVAIAPLSLMKHAPILPGDGVENTGAAQGQALQKYGMDQIDKKDKEEKEKAAGEKKSAAKQAAQQALIAAITGGSGNAAMSAGGAAKNAAGGAAKNAAGGATNAAGGATNAAGGATNAAGGGLMSPPGPKLGQGTAGTKPSNGSAPTTPTTGQGSTPSSTPTANGSTPSSTPTANGSAPSNDVAKPAPPSSGSSPPPPATPTAPGPSAAESSAEPSEYHAPPPPEAISAAGENVTAAGTPNQPAGYSQPAPPESVVPAVGQPSSEPGAGGNRSGPSGENDAEASSSFGGGGGRGNDGAALNGGPAGNALDAASSLSGGGNAGKYGKKGKNRKAEVLSVAAKVIDVVRHLDMDNNGMKGS